MHNFRQLNTKEGLNIQNDNGGGDIKIAGTHSQNELILLSEILCNTGSTDSTGSTTTKYTIYVGIVPPRNILSVYAQVLSSTTGQDLSSMTGYVTLRITVKYTTSTGFSGAQGATVTLSSSSSSVAQQVAVLGNGATFSTTSVTSAIIETNTTGKNFTISIIR